MEIHPGAHKATMYQAIAHNLSTIDRDLDMLRKLANARKDHKMVEFAQELQTKVHQAYADALSEFGIEVANLASDPEGHVHHNTDNIEQLIRNYTNAARKDETR